MKPVLALLWRPVRAVLLALAALVLAIEEWGWRPLTAWAARLARWAPVARLEAHIRSASPRTALLLFLVPAAALFPAMPNLRRVCLRSKGTARIRKARATLGNLFIKQWTEIVKLWPA